MLVDLVYFIIFSLFSFLTSYVFYVCCIASLRLCVGIIDFLDVFIDVCIYVWGWIRGKGHKLGVYRLRKEGAKEQTWGSF